MKKTLIAVSLILTLFGIPITNPSVLAQSPFYTIDSIFIGGGNQRTVNSAQSLVQSITGDKNVLVVPVGFPDIPGTVQYPTLVNDQNFPVLGVDSNGTLLSNLISSHGGSLPEDQWYGPGFNRYFRTESGGLYNVNFSFVKKSDGTRYLTNHNFSYWGNVYYNLQAILNETAQNMYAANPQIFNNVADVNFTFEGLTLCQFWNCDYGGTAYSSYALYGSSGQVLYQGPISIALDCKNVIHEYMHIIGAISGTPNGFSGFPDRGYDPDVYDPNGSPNYYHGNMDFDYDLMEHNGSFVSQHSLYGLKPLTSHDLIFLGWITADEILTVNSSNFTSYSDIKLADVNYPLTSQQKSNGYYRIVKAMIHPNYDGNNHDEYFLIEYHNASGFDKTLENYDEYQTGGYNTGVLIWHVKETVSMINLFNDNLVELDPAVPYNSWYGNSIPNDNYPSHGNFTRPPLSQYPWWNGIYSGDFNYLDDDRMTGSQYVYFPDGGRHIWETTVVNIPGWTGWSATQETGTVPLIRTWSMKSDFFSDSNVKGHITNSMTDGTRPSTKEWGYYNNSPNQPVSNATHIAITNIARQSGYMTARVYYNAYAGTLTQNTTISGNAYIAGNLTVNSGVTLTIASGATLNFLSGSSLTVNGTLVSSVTLTIPPGSTMTINPGAKLQFASGASLTANGVLSVNGTASQHITFTSTGSTIPGAWGSILLNGSGASGSTFSYANIQYGTEVDVLSANNVSVQNCNITNNSGNGIYLNSSSGFLAQYDTIANSNIYHGIRFDYGTNNNCYYNVIYKTNQNEQGAGIMYCGSSGTVGENDIRYYNWGIGAIWGASPNADAQPPHSWNNRITNCQLGLNVYEQSYCDFGNPPGMAYCGNSIYSNSPYNAAVGYSYPTVASGLYACADWWGTSNPNPSMWYVSSACYGVFNMPLPSDPWTGKLLPSIQSSPNGGIKAGEIVANISPSGSQSATLGAESGTVVGQSTPMDSLLTGIGMIAQGNRSGAKDFFMSYLSRHPDNQAAYVELYACADSETIPSIIQHFKSLPVQAAKEHGLLLSNLYLMQGDTKSARQVNNKIIATNPNSSLGERAMFNNFYIALYKDNDPQTASSILKEVEQGVSLSTPMEVSDAEHALATYVDPKTGVMPNTNMEQGSSESTPNIPDQSGLISNYPNPFNPSTNISYNLKAGGHVTLTIYDILGREVKTLVNENEAAGYHTAVFDASRLASGVYFYRLAAPGIIQVKKMVVAK